MQTFLYMNICAIFVGSKTPIMDLIKSNKTIDSKADSA